MKLLLILIFLASCSPQKDGCGQENYKHKFRARLNRIDTVNGELKLTWRRCNTWFVSYCTHIPDSIKVGHYYCI